MASTKTPTKTKPAPKAAHPLLQTVMAAVGLIITVGVIGAILWEALLPEAPPALSARVLSVQSTALGHVAEVRVRNAGLDTAAAVDIEGRVGAETATATLDYVPGQGHATARPRFDPDPRAPPGPAQGWSAPSNPPEKPRFLPLDPAPDRRHLPRVLRGVAIERLR